MVANRLNIAGNDLGDQVSEVRNLLINGGFYIDQEREFSASPFTLVTTAAKYMADGWKVLLTHATAVVTSVLTADAPAGFKNSLLVTTTTGAAVAAGDSLTITQPIEGSLLRYLQYGTINAGTAALSFWVKTGGAGAVIFSVALQNSAGNRCNVQAALITSYGQWTHILLQDLLAIPGDQTGTWLTADGAVGLKLIITLACGSTNQTSTLGSWQAGAKLASNTIDNKALSVTGATFQITGLQFEPGVKCTPYSMLKRQDEEAVCCRLYRKTFPRGTAPAQNAGVAGAVTVRNPIAVGDPSVYIPFEPPMAASPTITTYNPSAANANWRNITAAADVAVSVDAPATKSANGVIIGTGATVATLGDYLGIHYTADARL